MFFKNKETGLVHEVTNEDHIKRCKNDPNYEEVKEQKTPVKKSTTNTKASQKEE